jgi:hypothetical protein
MAKAGFAGHTLPAILAILSILHICNAFTSMNLVQSGSLETARRSQKVLSFPRTRTRVQANAHITDTDSAIVKIFGDIKDSDLRVIFDKLDVDKSGIITDTDWQSALKNMGVSSPTKEYSTLLSYLDFNNDGHVDFSDFQRSVNQLRQRFPRTNGEASATLEQWLDLNEKRTLRTPSDGQLDTALTSLIRKTVRIRARRAFRSAFRIRPGAHPRPTDRAVGIPPTSAARLAG